MAVLGTILTAADKVWTVSLVRFQAAFSISYAMRYLFLLMARLVRHGQHWSLRCLLR